MTDKAKSAVELLRITDPMTISLSKYEGLKKAAILEIADRVETIEKGFQKDEWPKIDKATKDFYGVIMTELAGLRDDVRAERGLAVKYNRDWIGKIIAENKLLKKGD